MFTIERNLKQGSEFHIYSQPEAEAKGIDYVDWKMVDVGDWGLTDDDYVAQCLDIYEMSRGSTPAEQIKYAFGRPIVKYAEKPDAFLGDPTCNFLEYLEKGAFWASTPQSWDEREAKRQRTHRAAWIWAQLFVLRGGSLNQGDWRRIGEVWRQDEKDPAASARRLFRQDAVLRVATKKLIQIMSDSEVEPTEVYNYYRDFIDDGLEDESDTPPETTLEAMRDLAHMAGVSTEELPEGGKSRGDTSLTDLGGMAGDLDEAEREVDPLEGGGTPDGLPAPE